MGHGAFEALQLNRMSMRGVCTPQYSGACPEEVGI